MRFRKGAKLDRSQVEDLRGRRVGGSPMALGGGGIVTLIIIVAIVLLGGNPLDMGGGASPFDDLAGQTAGTGPPRRRWSTARPRMTRTRTRIAASSW